MKWTIIAVRPFSPREYALWQDPRSSRARVTRRSLAGLLGGVAVATGFALAGAPANGLNPIQLAEYVIEGALRLASKEVRLGEAARGLVTLANPLQFVDHKPIQATIFNHLGEIEDMSRPSGFLVPPRSFMDVEVAGEPRSLGLKTFLVETKLSSVSSNFRALV